MMLKNILLCLFVGVLLSVTLGQEDKTSKISIPPFKTTTTSPTTTSTTTPSTTTSSTTTTTTPPTTTTAKTTTTPQTTTSRTTTEVPTTPAPTPTPMPEDHIGNWTVKEKNTTCILSKMQIQLNVTYTTTGNETKYAAFYIPKNATASGKCGNLTQSLNLVWDTNNFLDFNYTKNVSNNHYAISSIHVQIIPTEHLFPEINSNDTLHLLIEKSEFNIPLSMSYHCAREESINLFEMLKESKTVNGSHIIFSHLQLEAFRNTNTTNFSSAEDCEASTSVDVVPIAVGCALVILVVIVLVAYLVGRRRSQNRGYLSM